MNLQTHNKYFKDVGYNTDISVKWNIQSGIVNTENISNFPKDTPNYIKGKHVLTYISLKNEKKTAIQGDPDVLGSLFFSRIISYSVLSKSFPNSSFW